MITYLAVIVLLRTFWIALDLERQRRLGTVAGFVGSSIGAVAWGLASVAAVGWALLPAYGLGPAL